MQALENPAPPPGWSSEGPCRDATVTTGCIRLADLRRPSSSCILGVAAAVVPPFRLDRSLASTAPNPFFFATTYRSRPDLDQAPTIDSTPSVPSDSRPENAYLAASLCRTSTVRSRVGLNTKNKNTKSRHFIASSTSSLSIPPDLI
jgi:hypothetical protein